MDKFGIFNLLNSLVGGANGENKSENNQTGGNSTDYSALLNSILSTKKELPKNSEKGGGDNVPKEFKPLQSSMLLTMNRHDQHINRVKKKE